MDTLLAGLEHLRGSEQGEHQRSHGGSRSYLPLLYGLAPAFYVSRVFVEVFPQRSSLFLVWLVGSALAVLAGSSVVLLEHKHLLDPSPLLILYVYILWPWQNPLLAGCVGFVGVVALAYHNMPRVAAQFGDALLFLASIALYVHTLAPTILPADSGEFEFVAHVLGIAHPPGYPLYTMLAKLCTFIPLGDIAYRVNLFSAITSALTLLVLNRMVRRMTGSGVAGWIAAAVLGVSATFWAQSTTANIRSLTTLFTVLPLYTLAMYAESKQPKYLLAFAVLFGLSIGHHSSLLLLAPPYLLFLFFSDRQLLRKPHLWLKPLLTFLLSLSVLLYLPLRSAMGAPFGAQSIRGLSGFLNHVLALGFRGDMFYFIQPDVLLARLKVLWNILTFEFTPVWLVLGIVGAASLWRRYPKLLLLSGGVFLLNALTAATYRAPQTVEYLMPAYVALAFICAYGTWSLSRLLRARAFSSLVLAIAMLIPALLFWRNYPSFRQLSQDRSIREYAEDLLAKAPQGTRILSNWHYATPLWYLQYVEHARPDVEVFYVYPQGAEPIAQTWLKLLNESVAQRPTVVTNWYQEFQATPYTFQPLAGAFLVQSAPAYQMPDEMQPLEAQFDERIEFMGYRLEEDIVSPADTLVVQVCWRPVLKLERDYSFFVHLVDQSGAVVGQGDITHPAARYEVGQVILDEYRIPLLPTIQPGRYQVISGVYITLAEEGWRRLTTAEGHDAVKLATVKVLPLQVPPVTLQELYRPFACGYTLLGVDYDRSLSDQLRVYLHWRADSQVTEEYQVALFSGENLLIAASLPVMPEGKYFTTAHDLPAGVTDLALEVRNATGVPSAWLGPWKVSLASRIRLPAAPAPADARYIPLGGEMILVRAEYPRASSSRQSLRTQLTFLAAKPITHDYSVSVSIVGEDNSWRSQHDGTPALGAIPTLKWIRGVTVWDERDLFLPSPAAGRGVLYLTVYDAFTMRTLPVLDERLARLGQGTRIALGTVEVLH